MRAFSLLPCQERGGGHGRGRVASPLVTVLKDSTRELDCFPGIQ